MQSTPGRQPAPSETNSDASAGSALVASASPSDRTDTQADAQTGMLPRRYQWQIGDTVVYVVGIEGVLTHKSADSVTIAGVTLPRRLGPTAVPDSGPGVRYLSMHWPKECDGDCRRDDFDDSMGGGSYEDAFDEGRAQANDQWAGLIETEHEISTDPSHSGAFRFCEHPLCRHANRADRGQS